MLKDAKQMLNAGITRFAETVVVRGSSERKVSRHIQKVKRVQKLLDSPSSDPMLVHLNHECNAKRQY